MDTYEQAKTDADMLTQFTFNAGWGVAVTLIYKGENDDGIDEDVISDLEVGVTRINTDTVRVIGNVLCVPFDIDSHVNDNDELWWPVGNFQPNLPAANDDSHDARSHWFATESEAREHAKSVREEWENPNPWQSFIQTD